MRLTTVSPVLFICFSSFQGIFGEYNGKFIGTVQSTTAIGTDLHGFLGRLYAVNDTSVHFVDLSFSPQGSGTFFWVGPKGQNYAKDTGEKIANEHGSFDELQNYFYKDIILTLPGKITDYGSVAIVSPDENRSFGQVLIPDDFVLPEEHKFSTLTGVDNGVKATEVTLKDSATIELQDFHYDGQGNDVYFAVGPEKNSPVDNLTKLLDENGKPEHLVEYTGKTVTLRLPKMKHWNDYKWFTVYSFADKKNLGDVEISQSVAESLPWYDWEPGKRTTSVTTATKATQAPTRPKRSPNTPPPPAKRPSSPDSNKSEESIGFPIVIAAGVGVGIMVCIATSAYLFWFRSADKVEPAVGGGQPEGATTGTATGTAASTAA